MGTEPARGLPQCRTNRVSTFASNRFINNVSQGFGGAIKVSSSAHCILEVITQSWASSMVKLLHTCITFRYCKMDLRCVFDWRSSVADIVTLALQVGSPDGGCKPKIQLNTFQGNRAKLTVSGAGTAPNGLQGCAGVAPGSNAHMKKQISVTGCCRSQAACVGGALAN